jgi:dihydropteroate synthase
MNLADAHSPPLLMGIVNVTPDSFSDGGSYISADSAFDHAIRLLDDGADIVDIGGESTRPPGRTYGAGSAPVSSGEERRRVIPVIERLARERPDATISIDTMKADVARAAIEAGARIINDVSAGRFDRSMWEIAREHDVPYILMHGHDPNERRPLEEIVYADLLLEVHTFLAERIAEARAAGVRTIIADVGIGFAKGARENIALLREHDRFRTLGVPLLVGPSRKAFIGALLGGAVAHERVNGTIAACAVAATNGASILRIHDVRAVREFFTVYTAIAKG